MTGNEEISGFTFIESLEVVFVPDEDEMAAAFDAGLIMAKKISG